MHNQAEDAQGIK